MKAELLAREHLGSEVVVRMGRDRISGILQSVAHHPDSITVRVGGQGGHSVCCLDVGSEVTVL